MVVRASRAGWSAVAFSLLLAGGTAACNAGPAPPPEVAEDKSPRPTFINLDHAEAIETLVVAQRLLDDPVFVDAMALASLRCITVTMAPPTPMPRADAAAKLFDALRAQGMRIEHAKGMWTVAVDDQHPPKPCAPQGRATAASEAPDAGAGVAPAPAPADPEAILQEILKSIREISPTEHAITQRGLDLFIDNQAILTKQARIVPEQVGGKVTGLRLFGVRADGVLGRIGLENGDRIERVMGKSMSSPDQALEAYAAMRNAKAIDIEINRRGLPKKLIVRVE